ncbi:hypothetical protein MYX06_04030, partial [Patescibacteria group bacterium AH-259-L05]|nr:hypothetical protein [Patescibacteria group bacterium AH-259-L05]
NVSDTKGRKPYGEHGSRAERATMFFSAGDKVKIVSIYSSKNPKIKPNFFIHTKNKWVVFPWETDRTSKYDETLS